MMLFVNESVSLIQYINIANAYETRFKHTLILYNQAMIYNNSRAGNLKTNFEMASLRAEDSTNKMMIANTYLRKMFADYKIDYDIHSILIDENGEQMTISFSHSLIKVFF